MTKPHRPYIPYDIPLGDGQFARLVLPHDLTEGEADRICGVIRTLAFPDEVIREHQAQILARLEEVPHDRPAGAGAQRP